MLSDCSLNLISTATVENPSIWITCSNHEKEMQTHTNSIRTNWLTIRVDRSFFLDKNVKKSLLLTNYRQEFDSRISFFGTVKRSCRSELLPELCSPQNQIDFFCFERFFYSHASFSFERIKCIISFSVSLEKLKVENHANFFGECNFFYSFCVRRCLHSTGRWFMWRTRCNLWQNEA